MVDPSKNHLAIQIMDDADPSRAHSYSDIPASVYETLEARETMLCAVARDLIPDYILAILHKQILKGEVTGALEEDNLGTILFLRIGSHDEYNSWEHHHPILREYADWIREFRLDAHYLVIE